MINIEILSVRNPQWANEDGSAINCWIRTNTLIEEVPFSASPDDVEAHGREVYARCRSGEFGQVAPFEIRALPQFVPQREECLGLGLFQRFLMEANRENGRGAFRSVVILWGAFLDNLLDQMLIGEAQRIDAVGGAVGKPPKTFDERIRCAQKAGLIDSDEVEKCHHIRRIRNAAAHEWELSLRSGSVLASLQALHKADHAHTIVFHEDLDFLIQMVFGGSCGMLAAKFSARLQVAEP